MARRKVCNHFVWLVEAMALVIASSGIGLAQEAGSIDLRQITRRMGLRRPPARPGDPTDRRGSTSRIHNCGRVENRPVVRTTLVSLDREEYQVNDEPTFEVRITNLGSLPVKIPFSPHLADLQPEDPSHKFSYSELMVSLWIGGATWSSNMGGDVVLYGSEGNPGTMLTLQPGEWAEIIGKGHIRGPDSISQVRLARDPMTRMNAEIEIYQDQTLITSSDSATVSNEFCLIEKQGPNVNVKIK